MRGGRKYSGIGDFADIVDSGDFKDGKKYGDLSPVEKVGYGASVLSRPVRNIGAHIHNAL